MPNVSKVVQRFFLVTFIFALSIAISAAGAGSLDPTFSGDGKLIDWMWRAPETGHDIATQADGKLVVAGTITRTTSYDFAVARYNLDGSLDSTFGSGGKVTTDFNSTWDFAYAVAIQSDGKIVAAGRSHNEFGLVRYKTDGSLDTSFGNGGKVTTDLFPGQFQTLDIVLSVAIQTDGKVVAAGYAAFFSAVPVVVRYNPDGSLDTTFDSDGIVATNISGEAASVAIQADGKIVFAGDNFVARYNTDGSPDTSFDNDGIATAQIFGVKAVAIQPNGRILAGGYRFGRFSVERFKMDGSMDQFVTLQVGPALSRVNSLVVQPDGKIVGAGPAYDNNGLNSDFVVARLNADLSADSTFGSQGSVITAMGPGEDGAHSIAIQPDGKIVAAGYATGDDQDFALVRHNANGSLDTTFDSDGKVTTDFGYFVGNIFRDVVIQPDGKIVGASRRLLARYLPDGSTDTTFGGTGKVTSGYHDGVIALQPDGKIVGAGHHSGGDFDPNGFGFSRYTLEGALEDYSFVYVDFNVDSRPVDMAVRPQGANVLVGTVNFEFWGSGLNTDSSFPLDDPKSVALQHDGKVLVSGQGFMTARFNTNGALDTSFDGDGIVQTSILNNDQAEDVAVQQDGKIIVGGSTSSVSGIAPDNFALARYNTDGSLDTTFDGDGRVITPFAGNPVNEAYVRSVVIQSDGKILAAGHSRNGSTNDFTLVRYDTDGSLDLTFGGGDGKATADFDNSDDVAFGMALDDAGRAVVVGTSAGRFAIARFLLEPGRGIMDFDGDGKTDLGIFRPSPPTGAEWWYQRSSNQSNAAFVFGTSTDRIAPADFTGDGKTDVAFFRPSTGSWFVLRSEDSSFFSFPFGANGDVPVPADFDADGKADAAVFRPSSNTWFINKSTGGTDIVGFGSAGDVPVVADYDGDAKADIAIYRPTGGGGASASEWWVRRSSNASVFALVFGSSTDRTVAGDYTGDGKADVAFFRPSNGSWFILRSEDFSFFSFPFGANGDTPVPGDYDGDGKNDAAVFRPSTSTWFANRSTGGTLIQQFGITGDIPLPSAYVR